MEVLGYKVKASDMTEVAQKLEQLKEAMGSCQQDGLSQLGSETVHYNPSDLSTWINSLISELNPCDNSQCFEDAFMADSSSISNNLGEFRIKNLRWGGVRGRGGV
ncbi:hypothetical protein LIER_05528 [Lithospermum erythrorhizon]|uniref:Transcriptional factor DELLA N-terminal domain-containing protein n=1 Tax=Lithospermum erythrorhizon TaxID=34254 RepID=A0AAV3P5R3_LITER